MSPDKRHATFGDAWHNRHSARAHHAIAKAMTRQFTHLDRTAQVFTAAERRTFYRLQRTVTALLKAAR